MNPLTNSLDTSFDQQLHLLLRQADSEASIEQLREMLQKVGKQAADALRRNESLADAVVNSAEVIEELEQTRIQLAAAQDIAEQAAKNRGQLTETIFERTHDAMMMLKKDKSCLLANQKAIELFQFDHEVLTRASVVDWIAKHFDVGDEELWADVVALELDEHGIARREVRRTQDGKHKCVEFSLNFFVMHEQTHYLLIARDVSKQRKLEVELRRSRDFLNNTINAIPDQVCVKSSDLTMVLANDAFRKAYHSSPDDSQCDGVLSEMRLVASNPATEHVERALFEIGGDSEHQEIVQDIEGNAIIMSTRRSVFCDPMSGDKFMVAASRDVTEQKENEDRMQLLASVFENAQESVVILELDGRICEANPEFLRLTGLQVDELLNRDFSDIVNWERTRFDDVIASAYTGRPWFGRVSLNRDECKSSLDREVIYWGSLSVSKNEDGKATNLIAMFSDITQIEQTQKRLHRQALHDNLTGLPNRRFFSQRIEELIQSSSKTQKRFGVCFLDLDDFKVVNDTLGHDAGDQLLIEVADRIKGCIYRDCFLARFGGDEFALLIPEKGDEARIATISNKVVKSLNLPFTIGENQVYIGVSIGMTIYPDDASDVDQLLRHADLAMYQAKDEGKNTIRGFSPALAAKLEERQSLFNDLRKAIQNNDTTIVYQPKLCLHTGKLAGCEALVRWTKDGNAVCPGEFIDVAEKSGLILSLGDQIIEMAMRQAKKWRETKAFEGVVAINLSPRQMNDPDFIARFEELLATTETEPEWFELEITENAMMDNIETARSLIERLNNLGVQVAIDDFGTGYSSLNYLKSFPVSTLKIDMTFVRDLPHDNRAVAIAQTVLSLGHGLGMKVTAEGVETKEQFDFLKEAGCDVIQGYLINRPLPPDEFAKWAQQQD